MAVQDSSLISFRLLKIREQLTVDEQKVFDILLEIGPAHDRRILEALNQQEQATLKPKRQKRKWEINSVTGRRNHLVSLGVVIDLGMHVGFWHGQKKTYHIWKVNGDERQPVGWKPVKLKIRKPKPPVETKQLRERIRQQAQEPILRRMRVSEAGRVLVEHRRSGRRKVTQPTKQYLLFA